MGYTAEEKFGKIDGVIHAAGIIEDAPFLSKTPESAARVLAPKGERNNCSRCADQE